MPLLKRLSDGKDGMSEFYQVLADDIGLSADGVEAAYQVKKLDSGYFPERPAL
jgi:hypothetical protein